MQDENRIFNVFIPAERGVRLSTRSHEYGDEIYGINVNDLTKNTHRSSPGTPIHRFVPCRLSAVLQDQG